MAKNYMHVLKLQCTFFRLFLPDVWDVRQRQSSHPGTTDADGANVQYEFIQLGSLVDVYSSWTKIFWRRD